MHERNIKVEQPKVLLIEDDPAHIDILQDKFDEFGAAKLFKTFVSGEEALEYLEAAVKNEESKSLMPDVIMLDIGLPGEDGLSILKRLKASTELKKIPVIIYTASVDKKHIVETYRSGGIFFMNKEWNQEILIEAIQHIKFTQGKTNK